MPRKSQRTHFTKRKVHITDKPSKPPNTDQDRTTDQEPSRDPTDDELVARLSALTTEHTQPTPPPDASPRDGQTPTETSGTIVDLERRERHDNVTSQNVEKLLISMLKNIYEKLSE